MTSASSMTKYEVMFTEYLESWGRELQSDRHPRQWIQEAYSLLFHKQRNLMGKIFKGLNYQQALAQSRLNNQVIEKESTSNAPSQAGNIFGSNRNYYSSCRSNGIH